MSTTDLRMQERVAKHQRREVMRESAKTMLEDGKSVNEIGRRLGINESSVRSLLNEATAINKNKANATADILAKELESKGMLDVGKGVETVLGCSNMTLKEALFVLQTKGCEVYNVRVPSATNPKKQTTVAVLCPPGTEYKDAYKARDEGRIKSVGEYHSSDGGSKYQKIECPASIDSKRVGIRYGDEGGKYKDGVIELRKGVPDLDLGASNYAQVRILVDGTHYLKGMAMYSDDLPDGVDIMFNTNKKSGTPKKDVLKPITDDPDNPFGAALTAAGQSHYKGKDGKEHLSPINKLKEEGDWEKMSKTLSSQFLSKQPLPFIKSQLDLTYAGHEAEYDEIMSIANPTVRQKMLNDFASGCDSAAQHLKAAALPRQTTQVILPLTDIKENEVFAPNYRNGEKLALVRYPHAGTFEIPIVTVNNKNPSGLRNIGLGVTDAIGIHHKVAEQLSGADFDGDQVVAIPTHNGRVKIQSREPLKDLEGFDPKDAYPPTPTSKRMSKKSKQQHMGAISNLITDMTLQGATEDELARAVKHSMVVIDAPKHGLDYTRSERENNIAALKRKYQGHVDEDGKYTTGASTLISKRKKSVDVPERKGAPRIDPETGEISYKTSGRTYQDKKGNVVEAKTKSMLLTETKDLRTLSSGTEQEALYADYGNKMKALANRARKEMLATPNVEYNPQAAVKYEKEVASLKASLNSFLKNAPRERQAQIIANSEVRAKQQANPDLDKDDLKKLKSVAIANARARVGASGKDVQIPISDKEWEAIQAGAVRHTTLMQVLEHADSQRVRELALPKTTTQLTTPQVSKLNAMIASGNYTNQEIADALGCSPSTVSRYRNA